MTIIDSNKIMVSFKNVNKYFHDLHVINNANLDIKQGEVVVVNDKFGIRLTDIITPAERIRRLHK